MLKSLREDLEICRAKAHDYSYKDDAFFNFRPFGILAFAVFLNTKIRRLEVLANTKETPLNESVLDTLRDLRNYAGLAMAWLDTDKKVINQDELYKKLGKIYEGINGEGLGGFIPLKLSVEKFVNWILAELACEVSGIQRNDNFDEVKKMLSNIIEEAVRFEGAIQ